jgi:hypothetical protein
MTPRTIGTILIIISFIGCQTKKGVDQNEVGNADSVLTADKVVQTSETVDSTKTEEKFDTSDCVRGQAEPILIKDKFPNSSFKINEDGLSGTETTVLENGDKLIIINGGCEYYVLAFRFETSRFQADTTDIIFWLDKGIKLMTEVEKGIDSYHVTQGIKGLKDFLKTSKNLTLGEEIVFDDSEIRDFATVDRIQKITDKKYAIEISFATGPL